MTLHHTPDDIAALTKLRALEAAASAAIEAGDEEAADGVLTDADRLYGNFPGGRARILELAARQLDDAPAGPSIDWAALAADAGGLIRMDADAVDVAGGIRKANGYGYLASAYTLRGPIVRRADAVGDAFAWRAWFALFRAPLYSPLEAGHRLATMGRALFTGLDGRLATLPGGYRDMRFDPDDAELWACLNDPILRGADCVVVPPIEGRDRSEGVAREVRLAIEVGLPVHVLAETGR